MMKQTYYVVFDDIYITKTKSYSKVRWNKIDEMIKVNIGCFFNENENFISQCVLRGKWSVYDRYKSNVEIIEYQVTKNNLLVLTINTANVNNNNNVIYKKTKSSLNEQNNKNDNSDNENLTENEKEDVTNEEEEEEEKNHNDDDMCGRCRRRLTSLWMEETCKGEVIYNLYDKLCSRCKEIWECRELRKNYKEEFERFASYVNEMKEINRKDQETYEKEKQILKTNYDEIEKKYDTAYKKNADYESIIRNLYEENEQLKKQINTYEKRDIDYRNFLTKRTITTTTEKRKLETVNNRPICKYHQKCIKLEDKFHRSFFSHPSLNN